jgi:GNAT superfamily N-acetyltransferase
MAEAAAVVEQFEIETRDGTPGDQAFVFATLLRNLRGSDPRVRRISNTVFFAAHHFVVERALERGARIVIAHPAGDPGTILGYLLFERLERGTKLAGLDVPETVIHYVYTKKNFRGAGVARTLLASQGIDLGVCAFTSLTPDGEALWRKYPTAEFWGPYLA